MKRLISSQDVMTAARGHEDIYVDENTIVTAQALDVAKEHGVAVLDKSGRHDHAAHEATQEEGCGRHDTKDAEPVFSADELEHLISAAFAKGIWTQDDIEPLLGKRDSTIDPDVVPVGISGRHIHLSQHDLDRLFGTGYQLTPLKDLSQPGQFAAQECVTLAGPNGVIERVRVLGPVRSQTQIEVLAGDTFRLGIPQAVRLSGHLEGTPGVTVVGPKGSVTLEEGVIVAARHIHMNPAQAAERGFYDGEVVSLKVEGDRGGQLDNVIIRVTKSGNLDCHIDTEEANALHIKCGSTLWVVR